MRSKSTILISAPVQRLVLAAGLAAMLLASSSFAQDASAYKKELRSALESYTACTTSCSATLAADIIDKGVDMGLKTVGALKTSSSKDSVKYVTFYVLMRSIYDSGAKLINDNAACYNTCDSLNKEIVELGRAGLLGPMLKDGNIDEATFTNQRILDAYQKFVKPIQLPAKEKGPDWDNFIKSLS
ncbi:hypothetical protein HJB89_11100 [Rhizobium sp. NZLR8]|uniref:hypothetical protein n=1 Tax=Rhizobium sp. NZLR8 TaxID=2731104 RepID=UPI001C83E9DB|nr:hypothetical protein [Rhizobium sp. NZLR8]MBX5157669.1 hypothetical protein [Rhizobium sp. NZLR8]